MSSILDQARRWALAIVGNREQPVRRVAPTPPRPTAMMTGEYLSLYTYLENRYARTVVLTLDQIESLLGFSLPARARTDGEWWTNARPNPDTKYSEAWTLASRTATPNLPARTVTFERSAAAS